MQNYEDKRLDPRLLVEGARTVISVALNYYPETKLPENEYQIAWYAYGKDYHDVMKAKLKTLLEFIQSNYSAGGRAFCDTAPVLERYCLPTAMTVRRKTVAVHVPVASTLVLQKR